MCDCDFAWILGGLLLCVVGGVAARVLQTQTNSRVIPWVVYLVAVGVVCLVASAQVRDPGLPVVLAIALIIAGSIGLRNAPTKRDVRISEAIAPRLASLRSDLSDEAAQVIDETDRQYELHRQARQAFARRDLLAFRKAAVSLADIDLKRDADRGFPSLLVAAAEAGATDFVTFLLSRGARVDQADTYRGHLTPLQYAARKGDLLTVQVLVEHGANVNAQDQWGYTPLWCAAICHGGHRDIVDFLLRSGANPALADSQGRTPLDWATMNRPKDQNAAVVAALRAAISSR